MRWYYRLILALVFSGVFHSFREYSAPIVYIVGILMTLPFVYIGIYVGEGLFKSPKGEKEV